MPIRPLLYGLAGVVLAGLLLGTGFIADIVTGPRQFQVKTSGTALVGGPFSLVTHAGKKVTDADFKGRYMLVYFGYTFCPDICPAELQVMSAALDQLGEKAKLIQPVFITIDPKRDSVARMKEYVSHFHPSLIGLTGSTDAIRKTARAYRIYFARAKSEKGDEDTYLMDHSSLVLLMDKQGKYAAHFTHGTSAEKMAAKLAGTVKE